MIYYINYNNEKLPIFISHYAMKMLWRETNQTVDDILTDNAGFNEATEVFLFYCLESGHRKEKKIFDLKRDEMQWILDDNFLKFQEIIKENFMRIAVDISADSVNDDNKKKQI